MTKVQKIALLWHTVKYLRWRQIVYRLYYMLFSISASQLKNIKPVLKPWKKAWAAPCLFNSCISDNGEIYLFNKKATIETQCVWHDTSHDKLWLYHLHYLHDLNAKNSEKLISFHRYLIDQWITCNPPISGVGWEPYPLSLRIVNCIKWFSRNSEYVTAAWLNNLGLQIQALEAQIEYHILANHLFVNGKALIFAGAYFDEKSAKRWLKRGLCIIDKELAEQFLPDGGHYELSPMYHANLIWDVCDLVYLSQIVSIDSLQSRVQSWIEVIKKGIVWLEKMSHPDGEIAYFNDAAMKMAPTLMEIQAYANQLDIKYSSGAKNSQLILHTLESSGYRVVTFGEDHKLIADLAKVGVDYQPGHAHADTLSFELSLFRQRFLVNTGVSEYGVGIERQYQRSTLAHNTVCIDNKNSSIVWSGFRVAQRALPKEIECIEEGQIITLQAAHTGYEQGKNSVVHRRKWICSRNKLIINDVLDGCFNEAKVVFHFHPEIKIISANEKTLECHFPKGQIVLFYVVDKIDWVLEDSYWCSEFGKKVTNHKLILSIKDKVNSSVEIRW